MAYREGMGAKVGHDLVIDVTRWEATVALTDDAAQSAIRLSADPRSLEVREGLGGLKPLTDKDRGKIAKTIPMTQRRMGHQALPRAHGALKVRDDVEVVIDARLAPG